MLEVEIRFVDARLPPDHPKRVTVIATAAITNTGTASDGSGDSALGDYVALFNLHGKPWGRSFVFNYERRIRPVWALLHEAIGSILQKSSNAGERS